MLRNFSHWGLIGIVGLAVGCGDAEKSKNCTFKDDQNRAVCAEFTGTSPEKGKEFCDGLDNATFADGPCLNEKDDASCEISKANEASPDIKVFGTLTKSACQAVADAIKPLMAPSSSCTFTPPLSTKLVCQETRGMTLDFCNLPMIKGTFYSEAPCPVDKNTFGCRTKDSITYYPGQSKQDVQAQCSTPGTLEQKQ